LRVHTQRLSYGPHAVARHEGKVLFVRGGAPDEEVEIDVREERRNFAYADVVQVMRASPSRRDPPCPYLPECGGCPWQHVRYPSQLAAKEEIVREHLRRIGGLETHPAPIIPSPREYGYRSRLKLRVEQGVVGFYAGGSHTLVPVDNCLLAEPPIASAIHAVGVLASTLRTRLRRIEITSHSARDETVVATAEAEGQWCDEDEQLCVTWVESDRYVRGLVLHGHGWRRAWGEEYVTIEPEPELALRVRAGAFTQVNRAANQLLVRSVLTFLEPGRGVRVLDLYAGAGNFSLPVARRGAEVLAIERDGRAVEDGRENASRLRLTSCRFVQRRAEEAVNTLLQSGERFEAVLLDPPRSGAAGVIRPLIRLAPDRIIYVSCDPATLARDARSLASDYRLQTVQPIDMFPHTYHVESVCCFRRIAAS
jgi:23S rRNA (uracil1939-C5)-methyltransferase